MAMAEGSIANRTGCMPALALQPSYFSKKSAKQEE